MAKVYTWIHGTWDVRWLNRMRVHPAHSRWQSDCDRRVRRCSLGFPCVLNDVCISINWNIISVTKLTSIEENYNELWEIFWEVPKMYGQRRWTVPAPPSIKFVSTTICKIVTEMWLVVSPRSYAVRTPPRVHQQCTVKFPLLLSTLVLISLYRFPTRWYD